MPSPHSVTKATFSAGLVEMFTAITGNRSLALELEHPGDGQLAAEGDYERDQDGEETDKKHYCSPPFGGRSVDAARLRRAMCISQRSARTTAIAAIA